MIPRTPSIRRKLRAITMASCTVALFMAGVGFMVYDHTSHCRSISGRLETLAGVLADQSIAAVSFGDHKAAVEILQRLSAEPFITSARIYDHLWNPFADYARRDAGDAAEPRRPAGTGTVVGIGRAETFQDIRYGAEHLGAIYLRYDAKVLERRLWLNAGIVASVLVVSLLVAFIMVSKLEGAVVNPILHLAQTVKTISERKDYSIRASGTSRDETGLLIEGFNEMLSQIQARDAQLEAARANLEKRVEERTRELRLKEEQLVQAQKMEAVGRLAGGVAHDFNNMLTAILGYGDLAMANPSLDEQTRGYIEEIRKAGSRAKSLTAGLLAFSRRQVLKPEVIDLKALVNETGGMLRRLLGENITLVMDHDPSPAYVKADPTQIQQVILNLALNAKDAMPEGGRLTIRTANVTLREQVAWRDETIPPGAYVVLSVVDTGPGLSPEALSHIFEPFFTTKPKGQGTGLGLSIAYGIVKQSGGIGGRRVHDLPAAGF